MAATTNAPPPSSDGASSSGRRISSSGLGVAVLLLAVAFLMLYHWLTYSPEMLTKPAGSIARIPPTRTIQASGQTQTPAIAPIYQPPTLNSAKLQTPVRPREAANVNSPNVRIESVEGVATTAEESLAAPTTDLIFTRAAYSTDARATEQPLRTPFYGAAQAALLTPAAKPSPTPGKASEPKKPNILRRFGRWFICLFKECGKPIEPNLPPTVNLRASSSRVSLEASCPGASKPSPICMPTGPIVQLMAEAHDPDNDELIYTWSSNGGHLIGSGLNARLDMSGMQVGYYIVTIEVADTRGGKNFTSTTITVDRCQCTQENPPLCPTVSVICPDIANAGQFTSFAANIINSDPNVTPTYNWTVSAGSIVEGQGSSMITVNTEGLPNNSAVTASVDVGGYGRACPTSSSCTVSISNPPSRTPGRVFNQLGEPIPRATLIFKRGSVAINVVTDSDGGFIWPADLSPGVYEVTVVADGFQKGNFNITVNPDGSITQGEFQLTPLDTTPTPDPNTTPTPGSTPTPTPSPDEVSYKRVEEDKITVGHPDRFLKDESAEVYCEIELVNEKVISSREVVNGVVTTTTAIEKIPSAPPDARPDVQYKTFLQMVFESDALGGELQTPQRQPVPQAVGDKVRWTWSVNLKEGEREHAPFKLRLDVIWEPLESGESKVEADHWSFQSGAIPVGLPFTVQVSKYGFPAPLTGGITAVRAALRKRRKREDDVTCTVYAPEQAAPGDPFIVEVFAHLAEEAGQLVALAAKTDEAARDQGSKMLSQRIERETEMTFTLEMPGLNVSEPKQSLLWMGKAGSVQFPVDVPTDFKPKNVRCSVKIYYEKALVGRIMFMFKVVGAEEPKPSPAVASAPPHQKLIKYKHAFISYCSKDRVTVLMGLRGLRRGWKLAGITDFIDLQDIESGQRWRDVIKQNLDKCDLFVLFWSSAAQCSEEVKKEINYALERKSGSDEKPPDFEPFTIELPLPKPLPDGLDSLHFGDDLLYIIKAEESLAAERNTNTHTPANADDHC